MDFFSRLGRTIRPAGIYPNILTPTNTLGYGNGVQGVQEVQGVQGFMGEYRSMIISILIYLVVLIIIVFIVLLLVDRYITPVFQFKSGGPGFIPIPRSDDGTLLWTTIESTILDNTRIAGVAYNYTAAFDIMLTNPMAFSSGPRILFWRGPQRQVNDTPGQTLQDFNLMLYLNNDTNDLSVAVMTNSLDSNTNTITATLANVPTFTPFRICVVVMDRLFEVYMNGRLAVTKPLPLPPRASIQYINAPRPEGSAVASVRNLHVWPRILIPGEIRNIQPVLSNTLFSSGNLPGVCSSINITPDMLSNVANTVSNDVSNVVKSNEVSNVV